MNSQQVELPTIQTHRTAALELNRLLDQSLSVIKPPPKLTVSEWADLNRRLSPEASAEPGQWITARAEYQRGMMDAFSDASVKEVVCKTSAQVGKSEIILNVIGYHMEHDP